MVAEEEITSAAVEVDEPEKKEIISKLDITAQTDDIISLASSPTEGQTADEEAGQVSPREHHVFFIPQVEKLPWPTFIFLTINCIFPSAVYIALFTQIGAGFTTYYYLAENFSEYTYILSLAILGAFFILYILDIESWSSSVGIFSQYIAISVVILALTAWCLFIASDEPASPIALFSFLLPFWLIFIKRAFYSQKNFRSYVSQLSGPLFSTCVLTAILFLSWVYSHEGNLYNSITRAKFSEGTGCTPTYEDVNGNDLTQCQSNDGSICLVTTNFQITDTCGSECLNVYDNCSDTLIIWVGPILVTLVLFFFSFFASFIKSESATKDVSNFFKLWMFLMFIFWITISLNGASNLITNTLIILSLTAFVGSALFLASTFSREELKAEQKELWQTFAQKYESWLDIIRGLVLVTMLPVAILYLILSFINQSIRKLSLPCSKRIDPSNPDDNGLLTKRTTKKYNAVKSWDLVKVITYAIYWGIGYISLQVIGAQFIVLFLGWLIEKIGNLSLLSVTLIMVGVGLFMFLLPPVPGVPIYMTLGIVIPARGETVLGGIIWAVVYAVAVSVCLKLLASAMQQKIIGENLSSYTSVRKMVAINTSFVRSMRVVLSDPGFTVPKVAVLIGGPDWPTSVLAGIMKLDLLTIMIGTTPIVFLILPTVLSGTFLFMQSAIDDSGNLKYEWATTATAIALVATAIVQFGSTLIAAIYLEKAMTTRKEEIDRVEIDEDVRALEEAEENFNKAYTEITKWNRVPTWAKLILILSLTCMVVSCYIVTLFLSSSFANFEINDTVADALDGNWLNFIKPLGWISLGLFVASLIFFGIFGQWAKHVTTKKVSQSGIAVTSDQESTQ